MKFSNRIRFLLFGKDGQVGEELNRYLAPLGELFAYGDGEFDLTQIDQMMNIVNEIKPNVIVNAAAYTAVDQAEVFPEIAMTANGIAPGALAEKARAMHIVLIHYSTDFVFDGKKAKPYNESDEPNPLSSYGKSKLVGERSIQDIGDSFLILRTSWVYSMGHDNFVTKVLKWSRTQKEIHVVDDQIGSPTWARTLAKTTTSILESNQDVYNFIKERSGIYHLAGEGAASRYDWANAILQFNPHQEERVVQELVRDKSSNFPTPAIRPTFSALDSTRIKKTFGIKLLGWKKYLYQAMNEQL
ncbi:MAG: dTDP-4-dehydrorhamnose reductase [Anaerolineales bacterium]|nr:dTDP-4-dehydrorhamnose reductase [Anaerolineales bacterium]